MKCVSMFLVDPTLVTKPDDSITPPNKKDQNKRWWPLLVLLFFDPSVVEPAIESMCSIPISGQSYLKKILQVGAYQFAKQCTS